MTPFDANEVAAFLVTPWGKNVIWKRIRFSEMDFRSILFSNSKYDKCYCWLYNSVTQKSWKVKTKHDMIPVGHYFDSEGSPAPATVALQRTKLFPKKQGLKAEVMFHVDGVNLLFLKASSYISHPLTITQEENIQNHDWGIMAFGIPNNGPLVCGLCCIEWQKKKNRKVIFRVEVWSRILVRRQTWESSHLGRKVKSLIWELGPTLTRESPNFHKCSL